MTVESVASSDLTPLFKSCVKTIRTRNKAIGVTLPQTKIFPSSPTPFSQFYSGAKELMGNIISHRNLLRDHKKKYLQDQQQSMTESERTHMEKVVSKNLCVIDDKIRTLGAELSENQKSSQDASESQQIIMAILKMNFQDVNNTFKQMKELRKRKQKDKENLYRLHRPGGSKKQLSSGERDFSPLRTHQAKGPEACGMVHDSYSDSLSQSTNGHNKEHTSHDQQSESKDNQHMDNKADGESAMKKETKSTSSSLLDEEMERLIGELGEEERQVLEQENDHMYQELMSNREEVRQITRQVVELEQMQHILSENVDLQAHQIEGIQETVVGATENVRGGNEQVREAMRKDAGFRVWILFFLIVLSFAVLFLDWYNP